jgi:hypothetical protein
MNVEDARAAYRWWSAEPVDPTDQHEWLWMEALSLALDNAVASQFAEFHPSVRLTTPPKVTT